MMCALIQVIKSNMKKYNSSSKKKKAVFMEERSGEETATPRVKKSYSVTCNNYLQLQLDTSSKKRQNMQKTIMAKDKRINDLQKEVKQQQQYIITHTLKQKELKNKWQNEKQKNQRLQRELRDAVDLCKIMKEKCRELLQRNQNLEKSEKLARQKLQFEEKKLKEVKEMRRKEKNELKQLIIPLLETFANNKSSLSSEQLAKLSKAL